MIAWAHPVILGIQWVWEEASNPANIKLLRAVSVFGAAVFVFRRVNRWLAWVGQHVHGGNLS